MSVTAYILRPMVAVTEPWWDGAMESTTTRPHRPALWTDLLSAVVIWAIGVGLIALGLSPFSVDLDPLGLVEGRQWWHLALLTPGCLLVVVKRRWPATSLAAGAVLLVLDGLLGFTLGMVLVIIDLLFGVGLYGSPRARRWAMTGVLIAIVASAVVVSIHLGQFRAAVVMGLQGVAIGVVPLWWAGNVRQQRELAELAVARARAEAIHAERAATARDLHDVVAARLSATALHSGAALALPPDHDRDRQVLQQIRDSTVAALAEMKDLITVLRRGHHDVPVATARLSDLPELVDRIRADGVEVVVEQDLPSDLPSVLEHSAHRIVQEALTNVVRHGRGPARVQLAEGDRAVEIVVSNPMGRRSTSTDSSGAVEGGTGIWSMTERARGIGGDLVAGPQSGQWVVRARLPLTEHPVPAGEPS